MGVEHASWFGWMGNSTPWLCKIEIAENIISFLVNKTPEKHENTYIKPRKCYKTQKTRKCLKNTKMIEKHENAYINQVS
jgi:hypothetical protein